MKAEHLRRLELGPLLEELRRTIEQGQRTVERVWQNCPCYTEGHLPLLSIGDFDVYPRDEAKHLIAEVERAYHKEAAQNAAMRAALLASRHVLEHSTSELIHAQSSAQWLLERDRAYMAIQVALGEVGSVAPMARKAGGSTEPKRDLQSGE